MLQFMRESPLKAACDKEFLDPAEKAAAMFMQKKTLVVSVSIGAHAGQSHDAIPRCRAWTLLNANFRHASCSAGRLPQSLSNSLIQAQMTLTSPESPTSSTILKTEPMSPPALTRPHQSHSVDGLSPRPTISSVASLANKDNNQTQHVRRLSTGQMADETLPKERIDVINDFLQERVTSRPLIGIVCGSGLGGLSKCLENQEVIKYEDIPKFPRSTVEGHAGELVFGDLDGFRVVCMRGRFHCYEGYAMRETALPIRVMYLLGIKYLLVTNAAGGLNPDFNVGDLMIMNDHLNMPGLSGQHPLIGPNDARFGARFTPLSNCYDKKLQQLALKVAEDLGLAQKVRKGVYCFVSGPTYETPTECRFLRLVGGDAVGMSTVPEVIVAAHCGLKVVGLSLITNKALFPGEEREAASHNEVLETVQATQRDIETYVRDLIVEIGKHHNA